MNKCIGCGAILQTSNVDLEGYINENNIDSKVCERCFRIKNYNEYKVVNKDNIDFISILKEIGKTKDLVVLVVDLFDICKDINSLTDYLYNDIILALTKRDILPLSINNEKLLNYSAFNNKKIVDKVIVSANKNYGLDELLEKIYLYKKSKNVYIIGYTNAGKSTLINKFIYNYSTFDKQITTSMYFSTTLNTIEIELNEDLTLIDTPGILSSGNILGLVEKNLMKRMLPKQEIKTITYQIRESQTLFIEDIVRIDVENNDLTFYISNRLKIERIYKKTDRLITLTKTRVRVKENSDIVISGLGFIKLKNSGIVDIYTIDGVDVYTRPCLI